jgi:hypothetical protein
MKNPNFSRSGFVLAMALSTTAQAQGPLNIPWSPPSDAPEAATAPSRLTEAPSHDPTLDPPRDTYGNCTISPDIRKIKCRKDGTVLGCQVKFVKKHSSVETGGPAVVVGFLDLDTDQNPSTGTFGFTDIFGPPGTNTGLGMDFSVDLLSVIGGMATVRDASGNPTGSAPIEFKGKRMTVSIPLEALGGDDGKVDFATVLGTLCESTDIAPNEGHLTSK